MDNLVDCSFLFRKDPSKEVKSRQSKVVLKIPKLISLKSHISQVVCRIVQGITHVAMKQAKVGLIGYKFVNFVLLTCLHSRIVFDIDTIPKLAINHRKFAILKSKCVI